MAAPVRTALFGRKKPGGILVVDDLFEHPGNVFFVDSVHGSASNDGSSPDFALAGLAAAIALCTAGAEDVVYLMPGHVEVVAAATALAFSKAGVRVIGLGTRQNRPIIQLAGTDSTIAMSAANVVLRNVVIMVTIDEVVSCFNVTAANVILDAVDFVETAAKQLIQFLKTSALGTDLVIQNCRHHQATAPAANSLWIQLIGADRAQILRNIIQITTTNSASSSVLESDTTAPVNIYLEGNRFVQLGGASVIPVKLVAGTSGYAHDNLVASPKTAIAGSIALASVYAGVNRAGHVVNTSGLLEPVIDA